MILINMLQFVCSKKQIASRQLNSFNSHMKLCLSLLVFGRIHCCDSPISDADGQKEKGDDGVEEGGHDVANCPEKTQEKH